MSKRPIVIVCCDHLQNYRGTDIHFVRDEYIRALVQLSGATPLLLPLTGADMEIETALGVADGILLTGSLSNIQPTHYGAAQEFDDTQLNPLRDSTALSMIHRAVKKDLPVFAICRGFQELNVAFGGTLHQAVHKLDGKHDHRENPDLTIEENFHKHAHDMQVQESGLFQTWDMPDIFQVNSLHGQAVWKVGDGLHVEAVSDDGIIEAVSMPGKKCVFGVQWHPEGDCFINPPNEVLFRKFGAALLSK